MANELRPDASGLSEATFDTLLHETDAAPGSVLRRLVGLPVRGRAGTRIDRVLEAHGFAPGSFPRSPARRAAG